MIQAQEPPAVIEPGAPTLAVRKMAAAYAGCPELDLGSVLAAPEPSEARRTHMWEAIWSQRARASGMCLLGAADTLGGDDAPRARTLAALGDVRLRYEDARCAEASKDRLGPLVGFENDLEREGGGAAFRPRAAWVAAVRTAASDPATYAYTAVSFGLDLLRLCGSGGVRPVSGWPALAAAAGAQAVEAAANAPPSEVPAHLASPAGR